MISQTFRRVFIRSRNILVTTGQKNDYIAGVANTYRARSFSSSVCENTVASSGGTVRAASTSASEVISYPATANPSPHNNIEDKPVLLNSKEHAVGYLNRILNARVYEAAIETELQYAENLSAVRSLINCLM
jgi:hypothetical protein